MDNAYDFKKDVKREGANEALQIYTIFCQKRHKDINKIKDFKKFKMAHRDLGWSDSEIVEHKKDHYKTQDTFEKEHIVLEILTQIDQSIFSLNDLMVKGGGKSSGRIYFNNPGYKKVEEFLHKHFKNDPKKGYAFEKLHEIFKKEENTIFMYRWEKYKKSFIFDGLKLSKFVKKISSSKYRHANPDVCKFIITKSRNEDNNSIWYTISILIPIYKLLNKDFLLSRIDNI